MYRCCSCGVEIDTYKKRVLKNPNRKCYKCFSESFNPIKRLFDRIIVDKNTGCWNYTKYKSNGYGRFRIVSKKILAHRLSYEFHCGQIPDGYLVCHKCDNSACVNPEHLFVGTHKDNSEDCSKKGRTSIRCGEENPSHKLKSSQVLEILELTKNKNLKINDIALMYGVCRSTIKRIKYGHSWRIV